MSFLTLIYLSFFIYFIQALPMEATPDVQDIDSFNYQAQIDGFISDMSEAAESHYSQLAQSDQDHPMKDDMNSFIGYMLQLMKEQTTNTDHFEEENNVYKHRDDQDDNDDGGDDDADDRIYE